jgi:hypothetical protein
MEDSKGPFVYENWKMAVAGAPLLTVQEYSLFTDAHIIGEIRDGYGPYQLLNTVPIPPGTQALAPALILRLESYLEYRPASMEETDTDRYHGGLLSDEIAALVSLCLGIRLKAGGITRYFEPDGDPKGRPTGLGWNQEPVLVKIPGNHPILPYALGSHSLTDTDLLRRLPKLLPEETMALVRAARLYQDAMWIGESAAELAWIMFVSAIEIAASHWYTSEHNDVEILRDSQPDMVKQLEATGGEEAVLVVANGFAEYLRSAKKFRDFVVEYMPDPPKDRPTHGQFLWKSRNMKKAMVTIYNWRSRSLHGGIPFPWPMCEPARTREEVPLASAMATRGAVWTAKDSPMLLHTFEYIVRKALLKWWESMLPTST